MDNRKWISVTNEKDTGLPAEKNVLPKRSASYKNRYSVRINYSMKGFWQMDSTFGQQNVCSFDLPEGGCLSKVGAPMLISEGMFVELPENADFEGIRVLDSDEITLNGKYDILPVPELVIETEESLYIRDQSIYGKDEIYPETEVKYLDTINLCGANCVHVLVCPMRYRPKSKKLTVIRKLAFEIRYTTHKETVGNIISSSSSSICNPADNFISSSHIIRFDTLRRQAGKSYISKKRMLIISVSELKDALHTYLYFRDDDFRMDTVMCDDIYYNYPTDKQSDAIKKYIWAEHKKSPLNYVLLAGDIQKIPSCQLEFEDESGQLQTYLSDSFYGVMKNDYIPCFAISRLPAATHDELMKMFRQAAKYATLDERKLKKTLLITKIINTIQIWQMDNLDMREIFADT